jgi:hypothetical protein
MLLVGILAGGILVSGVLAQTAAPAQPGAGNELSTPERDTYEQECSYRFIDGRDRIRLVVRPAPYDWRTECPAKWRSELQGGFN